LKTIEIVNCEFFDEEFIKSSSESIQIRIVNNKNVNEEEGVPQGAEIAS
jgi:hypothetical protein